MKFFLSITSILGLLLIILVLNDIYNITTAKSGNRGRPLEQKVLGTVVDSRQKRLVGSCTGIINTSESTWLVSNYNRNENYEKYEKTSKYSFDLISLIEPEFYRLYLEKKLKVNEFLGFKTDNVLTVISKLNDHGKFIEVAWLRGKGCLVAFEEDNKIMLLTDIDDYSVDDHFKSVVFQSDGQGINWSIKKDKFFSEVNDWAWITSPVIYKKHIWVWKYYSEFSSEEKLNIDKENSLFYSYNLGEAIEPINFPPLTYLKSNDIRSEVPKDTALKNNLYGTIGRHLVQISENKVMVWISQTFEYSASDQADKKEGRVYTTSQIQLERINGKWLPTKINRINGLGIEKLVDDSNGKIIGIIYNQNNQKGQIAEFELSHLEWTIKGDLPKLFPLRNEARVKIKDMWLSNRNLIVHTSHTIEDPFPKSRHGNKIGPDSISGDGVFYTSDWGDTWQKLKIPNSIDLYGVNSRLNEIYWSKFQSKDIYSHSLK